MTVLSLANPVFLKLEDLPKTQKIALVERQRAALGTRLFKELSEEAIKDFKLVPALKDDYLTALIAVKANKHAICLFSQEIQEKYAAKTSIFEQSKKKRDSQSTITISPADSIVSTPEGSPSETPVFLTIPLSQFLGIKAPEELNLADAGYSPLSTASADSTALTVSQLSVQEADHGAARAVLELPLSTVLQEPVVEAMPAVAEQLVISEDRAAAKPALEELSAEPSVKIEQRTETLAAHKLKVFTNLLQECKKALHACIHIKILDNFPLSDRVFVRNCLARPDPILEMLLDAAQFRMDVEKSDFINNTKWQHPIVAHIKTLTDYKVLKLGQMFINLFDEAEQAKATQAFYQERPIQWARTHIEKGLPMEAISKELYKNLHVMVLRAVFINEAKMVFTNKADTKFLNQVMQKPSKALESLFSQVISSQREGRSLMRFLAIQKMKKELDSLKNPKPIETLENKVLKILQEKFDAMMSASFAGEDDEDL